MCLSEITLMFDASLYNVLRKNIFRASHCLLIWIYKLATFLQSVSLFKFLLHLTETGSID